MVKDTTPYMIEGIMFLIIVVLILGSVAPKQEAKTKVVADDLQINMISGTEYKANDNGQIIMELRNRTFGAITDAYCSVDILYHNKTKFVDGGLMTLNTGLVAVNDAHDLVMDNVNATISYPAGMTFIALKDLRLISVTKHASVACTNAYLINGTPTTGPDLYVDPNFMDLGLFYGGDVAQLGYFSNNTNLTAGGTYTVACTDPDANYDIHYSNATVFPVSGENINWTAGYSYYPSSGLNESYNIVSIETIERGDVYPGTYYYNFTVPDVEGVYEYTVDCFRNGKDYIIGKSFHVTNAGLVAWVTQ